MDTPAILDALLGGALIGGSAAVLLLLSGRIAGISGIVGGLLAPERGDAAWRVLFVAGLVVGGLLLPILRSEPFRGVGSTAPLPLVIAGLLVGFGARRGSGCTSGHGVCGVGRMSQRSLVATATFIATGVFTVFVARHVLGVVP